MSSGSYHPSVLGIASVIVPIELGLTVDFELLESGFS